MRTHDIHVSLRIFGLCSVSEFMYSYFSLALLLDEAEPTWVETKADISGNARSQNCHFCLRFTDATSCLEDGWLGNSQTFSVFGHQGPYPLPGSCKLDGAYTLDY